MKRFPLIAFLALFVTCQSGVRDPTQTFSVSELASQYDRSPAGFRNSYDGREVVVSGYVIADPSMPDADEDEGLVYIEDPAGVRGGQIFCWFSQKEAAAFSKLEPGKRITVKGVFNGENGTELRFCKLVRTGTDQGLAGTNEGK